MSTTNNNLSLGDPHDESAFIQRRVRHVTAVQIRNLTPFPARDTFASALTQPAEQSQFTSHGHLSDDLDVAMSRKRSRRISTNSMSTLRSIRSDESTREDIMVGGGGGGDVARRVSATRVSFSPDGGTLGRHFPTSGSVTVRPHRPRTSSIASSAGSHLSGPSASALAAGLSSGMAATFSSVLPDNSQTGLEKVIKSRLVETFLAITVPQRRTPQQDEPPHYTHQPTSPHTPSPASPRDKPISPHSPKNVEGTLSRKVVKTSPLSPTNKALAKTRRDSASSAGTTSKSIPSHVKSSSTSAARPNGDFKRFPLQTASTVPKSTPTIPTPNYFSPVHRPSTHPHFPIDFRSNLEDGSANCSGQKMKIEVWGKVGADLRVESVQGKGKDKAVEGHDDSGKEWKILDEWDVDLGDLIPLPADLATHPSQLPSNSLLITLSPPGDTLYLPPPFSSPKRPHSPATGYASDPEVSRVKSSSEISDPTSGELPNQPDSVASLSRRRYRAGAGLTPLVPWDTLKTAGWQDLFKLANLQACINDNESSLFDVVRGIDKVLEGDIAFTRRREVSERQARLGELRANHKKVIDDSNKLRAEIAVRSENLKKRKETLASARNHLREEIDSQFETEEEILRDRTQYLALSSRLGPTRTTLLTILSTIFPIDLLSPPDLLFTILDVPLPIPLSASDPAPPLTLPSHKDVTEDAVATSLGYAAQVVHLLAAYLGKGLVYPVTCIGSRSLIRDGISAMVGPRMFPLFSKGVDTYRFEYGVFLLNKNIELLMADRDLRALDMRHTLPNLKNLLLTLTDGEGARLHQSRRPDSPISMSSNMEDDSRSDSPIEPNSSTPKASDNADFPVESTTPPASGSTTPTAVATDVSKKTRPFLAFSPLTDFLRGRYPSSSSRISVKGAPESDVVQESEQTQATSEHDELYDEEDRKTISGVSRDGDNREGQKPVPDTLSANEEGEKLHESEENHSPTPSNPHITLTPVK